MALRVSRTQASAVDPWQLKVDYVSHVYSDTASAMCALDSQLKLFEITDVDNGTTKLVGVIEDETISKPLPAAEEQKKVDNKEWVPDVLMLLNRRNHTHKHGSLQKLLQQTMRSQFYQVYMACVFTRNPHIYLGAQTIALLMISWVKTVEQIFKKDWEKFNPVPEFIEKQAKFEIETALNLIYTIKVLIGRIDKKKRWAVVSND
ncbi:hypothetical protein RFI_02185 [Reticulomyxa filosa]|uniref:Uncharacterized protein n=1 Tax=Reticulomyxa filosa TaxID=46433 RepID=X6PB83_RETFI|nr:hypothetical protein RFI_02185 [Reticulomyxa filosa]|eukprot:ETO34902.1 hypothetical protein RFI_02185 [Reticulomyxa filosa]